MDRLVRLRDAGSGALLPTAAEKEAMGRLRAEAQARQEVARAEAEATRAEAEATRADAEAAARIRAEQQAAEAEAELARLRALLASQGE